MLTSSWATLEGTTSLLLTTSSITLIAKQS